MFLIHRTLPLCGQSVIYLPKKVFPALNYHPVQTECEALPAHSNATSDYQAKVSLVHRSAANGTSCWLVPQPNRKGESFPLPGHLPPCLCSFTLRATDWRRCRWWFCSPYRALVVHGLFEWKLPQAKNSELFSDFFTGFVGYGLRRVRLLQTVHFVRQQKGKRSTNQNGPQSPILSRPVLLWSVASY